MVKRLELHIIFLFLSLSVFAQKDSYVRLSIHPTTVPVNQPIKVTIKTNINGDIHIDPPGGFVQTQGARTGMSTSIQIINGKQTINRTRIKSFYGYFKEKGTFLFGPATVQADNKTHQSNTIKISVTKERPISVAHPFQSTNKPVVALIQHSKNTVYVGEPIVVEGKILSRINIFKINNYTPITSSGSTQKYALTDPNQVKVSQKIIDGRRVHVYGIGKKVIFPSNSGTLKFKPFKVQVVGNSRINPFPKRFNITSNSASIKVLPLPKGMPPNFSGGVGEFSISSHVHTTQLIQGDVVELQITVKGVGNLQDIKTPQLQLPDGLSIYGDTETKDTISYSYLGAKGKRTFTYFIQCNKIGDITIPPVELSYFNPDKKKYTLKKTEIPSIHVKYNPNGVNNATTLAEKKSKNKHLRSYLTQNLSPNGQASFFKEWGTTLLFSPLLLGAILGLFIRVKEGRDEVVGKKRKAKEHKVIALQKLNAIQPSNDTTTAVNQLSDLFYPFLAAQYKVGQGEISKEFLYKKVPEELAKHNYDEIISIMDTLNAQRFGGVIPKEEFSQLKSRISQIINTIEQCG